MDTVIERCMDKAVGNIFLGTVAHYHAAHRFYVKNGFDRINKSKLPQSFSIMAVDKYFYKLKLSLGN